MKRLINYFRECFCKHDWEFINMTYVFEYDTDKKPIGKKWTYRCKKCGCMKTHKNY